MQDWSRDSNNLTMLGTAELRRKNSLQWWISCLGLLALGSLVGQVFAAPVVTDPNKPQEATSRRELTERLEELIRQLRQERSAYYVEKARQEARIEKARENRKILQDELEDIRRQEAESDQQLRIYTAEVEDLRKQLVSRASLERVLSEQVEPFLAIQRTAVENGIPYKQKERIARLDAAGGDVNAPEQISMADQLGHAWNYTQEELRLSRSSQTYTARAKVEGEAYPYARFFRVGQTILGYITEDGRHASIWSSLPRRKDWLFVTDVKQSTQIRSAVEILDRRQGPKLITLPIVLASKDSGERGVDASP